MVTQIDTQQEQDANTIMVIGAEGVGKTTILNALKASFRDNDVLYRTY